MHPALCLTLAAWFAAEANIQTIAGTGKPENSGTAGGALEVNIGDPFGVEMGPDEALYICEVRNHRVWRLEMHGDEPAKYRAQVVAGSGRAGYAGDGGQAADALLNEPYEVRFDRSGNMYFVEMKNHVVRRVDAKTGLISTVAGTGKQGFHGDGGPATKALFSSPHSIALDADGNLYIADIGNHRIRRVDAQTGIVETIAGSGERKLPADGQQAKGNAMLGPRALFLEGRTMWIALREGHSVWKLDLGSGLLAHVAGSGTRGFAGDGGPAKDALFDGPKGIAVGPDGNVYVMDTENHAVRKIDLARGSVTTLAGMGPRRAGGPGDGGPATQATLNRPHGICVGPDGAIYIGDTLNHRVRRVKNK
jgi:streptogramin lyase